MTERDTTDKIKELLKPSYGLWTVDQQIKASQIAKAYLKNIKKHFKNKGRDASDFGELTTIDLNILNISQQEVERKMAGNTGDKKK